MFVMEHLIKMVEWLMLKVFHQLILIWASGVPLKLQSNLMPLENLQILWSDLLQFLSQIWHFGSNILFWILVKSVSCIILKVKNTVQAGLDPVNSNMLRPLKNWDKILHRKFANNFSIWNSMNLKCRNLLKAEISFIFFPLFFHSIQIL